MKRVLGISVAVIVLGIVAYVVLRYYFVVGRGMKAGTLNYVVEKGYVWKTFEGEMILSGFQTKGASNMGSNEFLFSITDKDLARKLMVNAGREMLVHYQEYNGALPWRGYSKFVVDSLVAITNPVEVAPGAAPGVQPVRPPGR